MKHLLSPLDLSVPEIDQLIAVAETLKEPMPFATAKAGYLFMNRYTDPPEF